MVKIVFVMVSVNFVQKGAAHAVVSSSRTMSVPGRNVVIVRSVTISTPKQHGMTDTNDGM